MDSPDITKIKATATSCSDSPPLQDSPFSSYINNLSPIKHVKATLVAQGLPALGSPPLVFTSPRNRETSFLKRLRYPQLSSAEVPKPHDEGKKFGDGPLDSQKPIAQLPMGLNTDTRDCETRNFVETQPCSSSGCGDEYLADPIEEDCVNSAQSVNPCLEQSNNVPESAIIGLTDSKEITLKFDNKNDNGTDSGTKAVAPLMTSEKAKEDLQVYQTFDAESMKIKEQRDGKLPSNECPNIESGSSVENASQIKYHQDFHTQDIEGGRQDDCDSTPKSPPGPLQIVQVHEDCAENIGSISNGMNENMMLRASKVRNNQYGMHRRCLQFEEAPPCTTGKSNSSLSPTEKVNNSESCARTVELEMVESSYVVLKTTSTKRQMATSLPPWYGGNSPLPVSKPSGIGLHLNSIVNAAPVVRGATKSIKLTDHHVSVQVMKSASIMSCHSLENVRHFPVSLNVVEKDSAGAEDGGNETETSIAASSAITQSPQTVEFKHHGPPHEKRKFDFQNADSYEECNQSSSKKKRKKTSSTIDSDGCKHCNCKKTKCLKLYCDCFAAGIYCAGSCACQGCFNREEYEDTVSETRQQIESRNPLAFAPKIVPHATEFPPNNVEGENQSTPSSARHKRGCNCKKSMCLKKYCECYQANVGCSSGCRCEGCKNVYGKKGEHIATGHSVTKEMISIKAGKERIESTFDEKLEMVATKEDLLPIELYDLHNLNPLTPSFQCSEFLPARCLPSPESDLTIISSYEKSTRSPLRNSESSDNLLETSKELLDVGSYDWRVDYNNIGIMDTFSPRRNAVPTTRHLTPLSDPYSMAMTSSTSSKTRDWTNASQVQLHPGNHCLSSASSLHWHSSPVTPMTRLGGTKSFQGLDSENGLYDILQDDTPEILKDTSTPIKSVKVSSPNKKRVSPPHSHNHDLGASSSEGLRSGRKFILKAVPSFPPLTPCIKSTGSSSIQNPSNPQDKGRNK